MKPCALTPGVSALTLKVKLLIGGAVVVLAIVALLSWTNGSNSGSSGDNASTATTPVQTSLGQVLEEEGQGKSESEGAGGSGVATDVISSVDELPVYEGARIIDRTCEHAPPDSCWIRLYVSASTEEIATFYREFLTRAGWTVIEERADAWDQVFSLSYTDNSERPGSLNDLNDPDHSNSARKKAVLPPIRRFVKVNVPSNCEGGCHVHLSYERWPDARELPVYPGAEEVTVNWNVTKYPRYQQVTRFVTQASPGDVEVYYKLVLTQLGWTYRDYEPVINEDPVRSGIFFRYSRPILDTDFTEPAYATSIVTLFTDPLPDDRTQVQLIAEGTEIYELWQQEQQ